MCKVLFGCFKLINAHFETILMVKIAIISQWLLFQARSKWFSKIYQWRRITLEFKVNLLNIIIKYPQLQTARYSQHKGY